jgi:hypothetical protein
VGAAEKLLELARKLNEGSIGCDELRELIARTIATCESLKKARERLERGSKEWKRIDSTLLALTYWLGFLTIRYSLCAIEEHVRRLHKAGLVADPEFGDCELEVARGERD